MSNPSIQIGDTVREMTDEEHAQYKKDVKAFVQEAKVAADRETLKQATLAKLGLTAEEISALLS
jgi:hypothetical protein